MNIGLTKTSYPEKRCITTSKEHNYISQRFLDPLIFFRKIPILKKYIRPFIFIPVYNPKIDIYHSFNDICITNKKWVVTFETMLPRFDLLDGYHRQEQANYSYHKTVNTYLKKIAAPNCLAAIAISESTLKIQEKILESYPDMKDKILQKTIVIYPPQKKLTSKADIEKKSFDKLKLIFVGRDFYGKGGSEIVIAIDELISEQKILEEDLEVTLVGVLNRQHSHAMNEYQDTKAFTDSIENIINKSKNIKILSNIKNEDLLKIIKEHHIGLLPTWADTFGYSVLEFQASGCPVISTNVRALPEINNPEVGWIIDINTNTLGEVVIDSLEKKEATRRIIINNLKSIILEAKKNKESVRQKAIKALKRIEETHSTKEYNQKIKEIYCSL